MSISPCRSSTACFSCLSDVTAVPSTDMVLTFIQSHPLVDQAVSHHGGQPVFHRRDLIFTHLVVDRVTSGTFGSDREYTVYYAGSSEDTGAGRGRGRGRTGGAGRGGSWVSLVSSGCETRC